MDRAWPPSSERLHEWRNVGDPPADRLITELFDEGGHDSVAQLMSDLLTYEWVGDHEVGRRAAAFLTAERESGRATSISDLEAAVAAGQAVFAEHGPEIILILGTYSLPAAYAAANGVKVLRQTDYLTNQPLRRLLETSQAIVDVMRSGGLRPDGEGVRAAEKIRLMHAAIRHLIVHRPDHPWDTDRLGIPINQEDMAATLMTFCYIPIDGLRRIGVNLTPEERESYLASWREVGRLMGVMPELLPDSFAHAEQLTRAIQDDQVLHGVPPDDPAWADGRAMTGPLLEVLDSITLRGVPSALMRMFLPADVANGLGVPRRPVADFLIQGMARVFGMIDTLLERFTRRSHVLRAASMSLVQGLIDMERGGNREPFRLPAGLDWYDEPARPRSMAQRLLHGSVSLTVREK